MATVSEALQLAIRQHRANRLGEAKHLYTKILKQTPNHPEALYGLGVLAQQQGQYQAAEKFLKTALHFQPSSVKAWFSLGNVRQTQGQFPEAIAAYQQALAIQPKAAAVYNNLGYTLQQQGNLEAAIACYQKALAIQPHCTEADLSLGNALFAQGKLDDGQKAHYAALNNDLGVTQKAGDPKAAISCYRQAIAMQPELGIAHYNLGAALQEQGKVEEAIACYQEVLARSSTAGIYKQLAQDKLSRINRGQRRFKATASKTLKVAFICQPFVMTSFPNPLDSIGILTYELVRRLAADCEVTVYAPGERQAESHEGVQYRYIPIKFDQKFLKFLNQVPGFTNQKRPDFASSLYYLGYILQIAKDLRGQFDVVHIHNFSQFVPVVRALNPESKIVLHMHCQWLKQLDRQAIARRLGKVDLVISPSQYISEEIRQRFPEFASRSQVVYNGANVDRFMNLSVNQPQPANQQEVRLLFVGRVSPEKGSHILLEAFRKVLERFPETKLDLVGPVGVIPYEYLVGLSDDPKIQALARFHQDQSWSDYLTRTRFQLNEAVGATEAASPVSLPGPVPPAQLVHYYQRSDIFIFPSVCHEAFGMPIAEAMIAGVPVIATRAGALPELVEAGKTGLLVERSDADALAAAILKLLADADLRKSMGEAGRKRAVERFSFEPVADELLSQYQRLCHQLDGREQNRLSLETV